MSSWRAQVGQPDTVGSGNQALWLENTNPDGNDVAAAQFGGLEGVPVQSLTGLEWQHRNDSDCGKTSPRWTVAIERGAKTTLVRFGCALAAHSPGSAPGWTRDSDSQAFIRAEIIKAGGRNLLLGTIKSLAIVYDVRGKFGHTILDNIRISSTAVGVQRWTFAGDNAATTPGPPAALSNDRLAQPLSDFEGMTFDELWPTLTPDEQALAQSQDPVTE